MAVNSWHRSYFLREAAKLAHFGTRYFSAELDGRFNPLNLPHNFWIGVSAQGIVLCAEDLVFPSNEITGYFDR